MISMSHKLTVHLSICFLLQLTIFLYHGSHQKAQVIHFLSYFMFKVMCVCIIKKFLAAHSLSLSNFLLSVITLTFQLPLLFSTHHVMKL